MKFSEKVRWAFVLGLSVILVSCGVQRYQLAQGPAAQSGDTPVVNPVPAPGVSPVPVSSPAPVASPPQAYQMYPLSWESKVAGSDQWSNYLENVILNSASALVAGSTDVTNFCSNYSNLSVLERVNFWGYLLSEVALYESDYDPTNRYVETTLGKDPVTGQTVVSEGLLQLSYQDKLTYPFCRFDWASDSKLSPTDPRKTILDPYINLECGSLILNQQVKNKQKIELSSGAYWSTLMTGSPYNKLSQIKAATQKLPFCQ